VIVPAWNEEKNLPACLRSIGTAGPGLEVIVADGGSTDRTQTMAAGLGARVVVSPVRQRATQLDLAVQQARGDVLLFLHADTLLPAGWRTALCATLDAEAGVIGGAFSRRFDHPSWWLGCTSALADWRGRIWGCFLGDQAMFIRSAVFWSLGGFRPLDQCEDLDLSLRMSGAGRTRLLRDPVLSSGRRFLARGPFRQTWADFATAWRFISQRPPVLALSDVEALRRKPV
jgi:rSAM/selenodomain-associated transferase 2